MSAPNALGIAFDTPVFFFVTNRHLTDTNTAVYAEIEQRKSPWGRERTRDGTDSSLSLYLILLHKGAQRNERKGGVRV